MNSPLLELIFLSERRKDLILFLRGGPKSISSIKENLNVGLVAILPQIKKLRESSLILRTGDVYNLSPLGIAIADRMQPVVDVLNLFESDYEYWINHAVDSIPYPLRKRIGELANCTFSEPPDRTHLFEPHREFVENLMKSKKIKGIASVFHPFYPSLFLNFAKNGVEVSLLVTLPVYERIKEEYEAEINEFLKFENVSFYVCNQKIEFAYAVTDRFLSLTLPFSDGTYDHKEDVICFDSDALQWGEDLFTYYINISGKITKI